MKGGRRPGAGRKQGFAAKNAEEARRVLSELVISEIRPIGEALIAKAKKGDIIAARELFDRAFGRPPQVSKIDLQAKSLPIPILTGMTIINESDTHEMPIYGGLSQKRLQSNKESL